MSKEIAEKWAKNMDVVYRSLMQASEAGRDKHERLRHFEGLLTSAIDEAVAADRERIKANMKKAETAFVGLPGMHGKDVNVILPHDAIAAIDAAHIHKRQ